jgi:hypothetical protein
MKERVVCCLPIMEPTRFPSFSQLEVFIESGSFHFIARSPLAALVVDTLLQERPRARALAVLISVAKSNIYIAINSASLRFTLR